MLFSDRREPELHAIDPAATAWLLASTALVLLMTPGLAIFYGGMVRTTGVLNMIMMSFISIPLVTVAWLLVGYTIAFSEDSASGLAGIARPRRRSDETIDMSCIFKCVVRPFKAPAGAGRPLRRLRLGQIQCRAVRVEHLR